MLLQDWQLAANTTNFELTGNRLEQFDSYEPVAAFQQKNGRHLMIVGQKIPLSDSKIHRISFCWCGIFRKFITMC